MRPSSRWGGRVATRRRERERDGREALNRRSRRESISPVRSRRGEVGAGASCTFPLIIILLCNTPGCECMARPARLS